MVTRWKKLILLKNTVKRRESKLMIDKNDVLYKPNKDELAQLMSSQYKEMYIELCDLAEKEYNGSEQIDFSKCKSAYGWNIKYKNKVKTIITLYPDTNKLTALIVLKLADLEIFDIIKSEFSEYMQQFIEKTAVFNNTKWIFIEVKTKEIYNDIIKLLKLKFKK